MFLLQPSIQTYKEWAPLRNVKRAVRFLTFPRGLRGRTLVCPLLGKLLPSLKELGERARFPMLELAMPALRKLDPEERDTLLANIQTLVQADNRVTLFELALTTFLWRHLGRGSGQVVPVKYRSFRQVKPAIEQVLSLFARAGTEAPEKAQALYQEAISGFGNGNDETMHSKITMQNLRAALNVSESDIESDIANIGDFPYVLNLLFIIIFRSKI